MLPLGVVGVAMSRPWWRAAVLSGIMPGRHPVVCYWHGKDRRGHMLTGNEGPWPIMGRGIEPGIIMEDVVAVGVEEVIMGDIGSVID